MNSASTIESLWWTPRARGGPSGRGGGRCRRSAARRRTTTSRDAGTTRSAGGRDSAGECAVEWARWDARWRSSSSCSLSESWWSTLSRQIESRTRSDASSSLWDTWWSAHSSLCIIDSWWPSPWWWSCAPPCGGVVNPSLGGVFSAAAACACRKMPIRVLSRVSIFASCCRRTSPRAELSVELPRFTFGGEGRAAGEGAGAAAALAAHRGRGRGGEFGQRRHGRALLNVVGGGRPRRAGAESMETSTPRRSRSAGVSAGWGSS